MTEPGERFSSEDVGLREGAHGDESFEDLKAADVVENEPVRGLGAVGQLLATLAAAFVLGLVLLAAAAAAGWILR